MLNVAIVIAGTAAAGWWLAWLRGLPPRDGSAPPPDVSVVVPARNEAASLPNLLASLRDLDPAPREVIVVDDGSDDCTTRLARDAGAVVVSLSGPPEGWLGKPWTCQQGADRATGELLLFLDADVRLAPDALARLVAARDPQGGILSVAPHHRPGRGVEHLSSWFNLVTAMASGAFSPIEPQRARVAFGPCLLVDRRQYRELGGHAAVRDDVVEDLGLAEVFGAADLPVRCRAGGDTVAFRMYPEGFASLVEGWTKNIATGPTRAAPLPVLGAVLWVSAAMVVTVGVLRALLGLTTIGWWSAGWLLVAATSWWGLRRLGRFSWWTWVVFPVPLCFFVGVFARSAWASRVRGVVRWRGRSIPVRSAER